MNFSILDKKIYHNKNTYCSWQMGPAVFTTHHVAGGVPVPVFKSVQAFIFQRVTEFKLSASHFDCGILDYWHTTIF